MYAHGMCACVACVYSHMCVCMCVYAVMQSCLCVHMCVCSHVCVCVCGCHVCNSVHREVWEYSVVASLLLWASWTRSSGLDLSPTEPFHQPFVDYFYDYNLFKMSWHYERFLLVQEDSTSWLILGHRGGFQGRVSAIPLTLSLSFRCLGSQDSSDGSFLLALHPCLWLVDVLNLCIPARPGLSISQGHSS